MFSSISFNSSGIFSDCSSFPNDWPSGEEFFFYLLQLDMKKITDAINKIINISLVNFKKLTTVKLEFNNFLACI
jgi:hypothetical protein